jgi:hypothetical protein
MTFNLIPIFGTLGSVMLVEVSIYLFFRGKSLVR